MGEVAEIRHARTAASHAAKAETFEAFFEDEKDRLLRILSVITGSRAEAEDLAQEAFTMVFERWDRVAAMDEPAGYSPLARMDDRRGPCDRRA